MHGVSTKLWRDLFVPVDSASLVLFRIAFGVLLLVEVLKYPAYGWIEASWIDLPFHFKYYGFEWVRPWPRSGMYIHFYAMAVFAFCVGLGFYYRISATLFFMAFVYVTLLDQAYYLNHFYLISLVGFLMILVPAHCSWSIDAWRQPAIRARTVPAWSLWILRTQFAIPYFYGGLAKLNGDWLRGEPMRTWLAERTEFPIIGRLFTEPWMAYLSSYSALVIDLLVVPLLLWRRTRLFAFVVVVWFHLMNSELFGTIGVFPWFMIAGTTLFFSPGWPRYFVGRCWAVLRHIQKGDDQLHPVPGTLFQLRQLTIIVLLSVYALLQLLMPFRHHLYPGNASWTWEGQRFAWRMMLNENIGRAQFHVTDPFRGTIWEVDPMDYLNHKQWEMMIFTPDMILQFCHHIADDMRQEYGQIEVRAKVVQSLDGRKPQWLIDPTVDLAAQRRTLTAANWIVPLCTEFGQRMKAGDLSRLLPPSGIEHNNEGLTLRRKGRLDEAIRYFQASIQVAPDLVNAHRNLAVTLVMKGRVDQAISHFRTTLRLDPEDAQTHFNLALALESRGKVRDAMSHYRQALQFRMDYAEAHNNLAVILASQGRTEEAISHYRSALQIRPEFVKVQNNLGLALQSQGKIHEAIRYYTEALRNDPDYSEADNNLRAARRLQ